MDSEDIKQLPRAAKLLSAMKTWKAKPIDTIHTEGMRQGEAESPGG